eukprot:1157251-Pelagomonas_calceolata.AAC.10
MAVFVQEVRHSARQHVPIPEYADNLRQMVAFIRGLGVQTIVLMTPPPVHDAGRKDWQVLAGAGMVVVALFGMLRLLELPMPCPNYRFPMQVASFTRKLHFV